LFKAIRISILVVVFLFVAIGTRLSSARATDWKQPLWVAVYPINGDGSETTANYINRLSDSNFDDIESFLAKQIRHYRDIDFDPVEIYLAPVIEEIPPEPPAQGNVLEIAFWSLGLRFWSWRTDTFDTGNPEIRIYMVYHDPVYVPQPRHSLGLKEGRIGVVYGFADPRLASRNNVVIAHEMLHTLGATDKYLSVDNYPQFPYGFAEPARQPRFPQRFAEIMAGRIPLSPTEARMPASLKSVVVGDTTAAEISW